MKLFCDAIKYDSVKAVLDASSLERMCVFSFKPCVGGFEMLEFFFPEQLNEMAHVGTTTKGEDDVAKFVSKIFSLGADYRVGWWHTHPDSGSSTPSPEDKRTTEGYGVGTIMLITTKSTYTCHLLERGSITGEPFYKPVDLVVSRPRMDVDSALFITKTVGGMAQKPGTSSFQKVIPTPSSTLATIDDTGDGDWEEYEVASPDEIRYYGVCDECLNKVEDGDKAYISTDETGNVTFICASCFWSHS